MLLRCLESGLFALSDSQPLTATQVATRVRGNMTPVTPAPLHLLLPAPRCLVTTVPVAKHETRLIALTLPWTLEERLLEPVEQLHFAHGPVAAGAAPVTVINSAWLQQVLGELRAAGLEPQSACSDISLLPWQGGQWTVFIPAAADAAVLVRHGEHAGFACARANLQTALQLLLNEHNEPPHHFTVIAEASAPVDDALFPALLQSRVMLQRQSLEQRMRAAVLPTCNLLQGRFAPPLPWAQWWRQWRLAAAVLAALLVTDLALSAYATFSLNREAERNEAALLALYRSVQPDGVVVDPRLQLEQALAAVGATGQDSFLALLSRMAPALQASPDATVQNLEYDGSTGDLQVQLLTSDYAVAETLRTRLQQLGLQAELLGSSSDSAGSRTRLRVGG